MGRELLNNIVQKLGLLVVKIRKSSLQILSIALCLPFRCKLLIYWPDKTSLTCKIGSGRIEVVCRLALSLSALHLALDGKFGEL